MRVGLLLILFLLAPFAGAGEIDGRRQQAEMQIRKVIGRWLVARRGRWRVCRSCAGLGRKVVHSATDGREVTSLCKQCEATGVTRWEGGFRLLYWDRYSARYRTEAQGRRYEQMTETLRKEPKLVGLDELTIDSWGDIRIVVYGNFAAIRMRLERAGNWTEETRILIEDPAGTWCLRHPRADAEFPLIVYPETPTEEDEE